MKLAEIAPELVVKMILTCSGPIEGLRMMNGDKECKTAEDIKGINHIGNMLTMLEEKNWEAMMAIFNAMFFAKIKDFSNEKKEALAKYAMEQRCFLEASEAAANADVDKEKVKAEVRTY